MDHLRTQDNSSPKITTIMAVYNGEKYILEAISSLISQSYHNHEILVVDDGSTDNTADIVKNLHAKVTLLRKENGGVSSARNLGITHSKGHYINFCDHDDICPPDRLFNLLEALQSDPDIDFAFGHVEEFSDSAKHLKIQPTKYAPGVCSGGIMIKKSAIEQIGQFDTSLSVAEFMDYFLRAKDLGLKFKIIPQTVLKRRIHNSNNSFLNRERLQLEYTTVLKNSLNRRKQL